MNIFAQVQMGHFWDFKERRFRESAEKAAKEKSQIIVEIRDSFLQFRISSWYSPIVPQRYLMSVKVFSARGSETWNISRNVSTWCDTGRWRMHLPWALRMALKWPNTKIVQAHTRDSDCAQTGKVCTWCTAGKRGMFLQKPLKWYLNGLTHRTLRC